MSYFYDPTGRSTYGIGICDRCKMVFSIEDLFPDPNSPGLKVCLKDLDDFDPYRLPARQTERINLPFVRPDRRLDGTAPAWDLEAWFVTELGNDPQNDPLITENGQNLREEGLDTSNVY